MVPKCSGRTLESWKQTHAGRPAQIKTTSQTALGDNATYVSPCSLNWQHHSDIEINWNWKQQRGPMCWLWDVCVIGMSWYVGSADMARTTDIQYWDVLRQPLQPCWSIWTINVPNPKLIRLIQLCNQMNPMTFLWRSYCNGAKLTTLDQKVVVWVASFRDWLLLRCAQKGIQAGAFFSGLVLQELWTNSNCRWSSGSKQRWVRSIPSGSDEIWLPAMVWKPPGNHLVTAC